MKLGQMVDVALSKNSIAAIKKSFSVKCLKSDNPGLYEKQKLMKSGRLVSQGDYEKAVAMAKKVLESEFYAQYKKWPTMFQVILQSHYEEIEVCGMADALTILDDRIYLDDFKTCSPHACRTSQHWYWHCEQMGYLRQMAHYRELVRLTYPDKRIICRHIVITNEENVHNVSLYELSDQALKEKLDEFKYVMNWIASEMASTEPSRWKDKIPDQNEAIILYPNMKAAAEFAEIMNGNEA